MDGTNGRGYVEPPGGDKARRSLDAWVRTLGPNPLGATFVSDAPAAEALEYIGPPGQRLTPPVHLHLIVRDDCAIIVERVLMLGEPPVPIDGRTLAVIQRECGDAIATALGYLTEPQQQAVLRAVL